MHKYRPNEMASHQDDEQRHARPFYDEASSSISLPPFLPPFDAAHDTIIRSQRLRASQLGLIDQSATLPRDEEQDRFPNAQADFEATTIASPSVDRTENVHDAGSRAYSGTSSTTERRRYWQRRLKENMRQLKKKMNVRDFLTGLQVFALIALIVLLLTTSNTVGSMNMKLLSERNEMKTSFTRHLLLSQIWHKVFPISLEITQHKLILNKDFIQLQTLWKALTQ